MEEGELSALVGRWARIRPVHGRLQSSASGSGEDDLAEGLRVAVVGNSSTALRIECGEHEIVDHNERVVLMEFGSSEALVRFRATLRVLVENPLPVVLAATPIGMLEHLQRREWVRARVCVPVELEVEASSEASGDVIQTRTFRTVTVDMSGGGVKLASSWDLHEGDVAFLTISLPGGEIEVTSRLLERMADGCARFEFQSVPEAISKRIVRLVFDAQMDPGLLRRSP